MKKILALSLLAIGLIAADVPLKINGKVVMERHPLPVSVLSQESGGPLSAIDAYSDGIGVMLVSSPTSGIQIDNSGLNSLVYKHGEAAKSLGAPLKDYVLTNISDPVDVAIAEKLNDAFADGDSCDDGDANTINDIYTDGVCAGKYFVSNGQYSDGTKANTCWDYYNGNSNYEASTTSNNYLLADGREAYCNMPALVKIKTSNDWTGLTSVIVDGDNPSVCFYVNNNSTTFYNLGIDSIIFGHPTNDSSKWCGAKLIVNNMFKSISIQPKHVYDGGDGGIWQIDGENRVSIIQTIAKKTNATTQKIFFNDEMRDVNLRTNSGTNDNFGDHILFDITGYEE